MKNPESWPADKVERWPIARLIPYARNARTHSDDEVKLIAASMREYGWTNPVLVDEDGTLIAGHGRILAAPLLGWTQAPTMVARGWSEAKKRAYRLADNQIALKAGWDASLLALELDDLRAEGIDLASLGFDGADLAAIFGTGEAGRPGGAGNLAEKFGVPPFSVLSARGGWWQGRKDAWIALGIQSELGRGDLAGDRSLSTSARINDAAEGQRRYTAAPGGSLMPARDKATGRLVRGDSRARPIPGTGAKRDKEAARA